MSKQSSQESEESKQSLEKTSSFADSTQVPKKTEPSRKEESKKPSVGAEEITKKLEEGLKLD